MIKLQNVLVNNNDTFPNIKPKINQNANPKTKDICSSDMKKFLVTYQPGM